MDIESILSKTSHITSKMSEEEKKVFIKILQEMGDKGSSELLNKIYLEDYEEIPVSIDEFIENPIYAGNFTGNGELIYPYWRERLREMFETPGRNYSELALTGCLSGDTLIPLLSGKEISMRDLSNIGNLDEYVYSFDVDSNRYVAGHLIKAFSTGIKSVYEITIDNGEKIKATSNHKFMMRDKQWKSIDTGLKPEDSMMPFNTSLDKVSKSYNHKITSIEYIGDEEVYDLTVERYHNFALSSGIVAHNSIGIGKSTIAVLGLAYCLYKLMCLKDPQAYYRLAKGSIIVIAFFNNTLDLSNSVGYQTLQALIQDSEWFMERGKIIGTKNKEYIPNKLIRYRVGSRASHVLGQNVYCVTGDTIISTEKGDMKISDLDGKYVRVYSQDDERNITLSSPSLVINTKSVNEIYKIELDDGSIVRCTRDHKLRLKSGEYKRVSELSENDELEDIQYTYLKYQNMDHIYTRIE